MDKEFVSMLFYDPDKGLDRITNWFESQGYALVYGDPETILETGKVYCVDATDESLWYRDVGDFTQFTKGGYLAYDYVTGVARKLSLTQATQLAMSVLSIVMEHSSETFCIITNEGDTVEPVAAEPVED